MDPRRDEARRLKKVLPQRGLWQDPTQDLFNLCFFIHHMLASLGIELLDLHFLGHCLLVLCGGVEVPGACTGL